LKRDGAFFVFVFVFLRGVIRFPIMGLSIWNRTAVLLPLIIGTAFAAVRFVDQDAAGANNGSSWENAYTSLATAIGSASTGDEFWVAEGIHLPAIEANGGNMEPGPRAASFGVIGKSVKFYGGFEGTEDSRSERDWVAHPTILSGDLGVPGDSSDNAYTVLHSYSSTLFVDGFTIRDGNSNGTALGTANDFDGNGAAVFQSGGTMTFANCRFYDNYASYGGAMYLISGSITLLNCSFVNNEARWVGGAIDGRGDFSHRISHCSFFNNRASRGAAFTFDGNLSTTTVTNSLFGGNSGGNWAYFEVSGGLVATRNILQQELNESPDNLVASARFINGDGSYAEGVRRLEAGSPGVDYGNAGGVMNDVTDMDGDGDFAEPMPLDLLGEPRPLVGASVGAFQYFNLPSTALLLSANEIEENRAIGTRVGFLSTEDPNLGQFEYTFVNGPEDVGNASFLIEGNRLVTAEMFDYETQSSYEVRIRSTDVSDGLGQFIEQAFMITILDSTDQTLSIEAVQPYAYEPYGGWQEGIPHVGRVRIERAGDVGEALSVGFSVSITVFGNDEEFILQPEPPEVLEFAPSETVFEFEVIPLFDDDNGDDEIDDHLGEEVDQVFFTLSESPLEYQLLQGSAIVSIYGRQADAWIAEQNADGFEVNLFDYLLADPTAPGGVTIPQFHFDPLAGFTATVVVDRSVLDYRMGIETSGDLIEWTSPGLAPAVVDENETHQTVRYVLPVEGTTRKFVRLVPEPLIQPEARVLESPSIMMSGIPAGGFYMGSPSGEVWRGADEGPLTNVQHTRPFWMSSTEVTQGQYRELAGEDPGEEAELPKVNVTFDQASQFADALDHVERTAGRVPDGYCYRLPTEAEWEYACRAGENSSYHFGSSQEIGDYAWYIGNSFLVTRAVGQKAPNQWGLYDITGNVSEWCLDFYHSEYPGGIVFDPFAEVSSPERSIRGGHIFHPIENQRSAFRQMAGPTFSSSLLGFRIVLAPVIFP
jgi:formylglycine-generating enzyme required for sulfatase activity